MLETRELLWDLNIELGRRDNINAQAKTGRKGISKKNNFKFSMKLPNKLEKIHCLLEGKKKKKSKKEIKGRKMGGRKERKEEKEDADTTWITEILGTKI